MDLVRLASGFRHRSSGDLTSSRRALVDWLLTPRVAVLAAFILSLPALRTGLVADDTWHRAMLLHDPRLPLSPSGGPLSLFTFASSEPTEHARAIEYGLLPWWSSPSLRIAFFRPIASLTHALDYALWPTHPAAMHLHSILWYVLVLVLAAALYRRWLGPLSAKCAAIATVFYALDPTHGIPVGWIANRNALIATAFAFATLLCHDIGAKRELESETKKSKRFPVLLPFATALTLALALGAGESAIAVVVYLAAHAMFLDERPIRARLRSLVPSAIVTLAWAVVYRIGHFGVVGSGIYYDPIHAPLAFARAIATNAPLLLASELGVSPDAWPILPFAAKVVLLCVCMLLLMWAASVVRRAVFADDERVRRMSRFFLVAGCVSVIPSVGTLPSGRLLFIPGFALVGMLAMVCASALPNPNPDQSTQSSRSTRAFAKWCWFVHLVIAPFMFVVALHSMALLRTMIQPLAAGIPSDGASTADKRLVLVNAPDTMLTHFALVEAASRGGTPPERLLVMASNRRDVRFTRVGEHMFLVHEDGGFTRTGMELLFRDIRTPLPIGTTIALSDVTITITHTTRDNVPDEASFELTKGPLDDAYVFRKWEGTSLVAFSLPPVGESVTFEGWAPGLH